MVTGGHVRVNGARTSKPAQGVVPGDTLTFAQGNRVRVVRIEAIGVRRGPAAEARSLYEDLSPEVRPDAAVPRPEPGGRPTKKARRDAALWKDGGPA